MESGGESQDRVVLCGVCGGEMMLMVSACFVEASYDEPEVMVGAEWRMEVEEMEGVVVGRVRVG
jgi:hypothetical protein